MNDYANYEVDRAHNGQHSSGDDDKISHQKSNLFATIKSVFIFVSIVLAVAAIVISVVALTNAFHDNNIVSICLII